MSYYVVARGNGLVFAESTKTLAKAREIGLKGTHHAIYRETGGFHSTAQEEYLVEHCCDPYWLNRGVKTSGACGNHPKARGE